MTLAALGRARNAVRMQKLRLELEAEVRGGRASSRELRHMNSDVSKTGAPFDPGYDKMGENESAKDQVRQTPGHLY